jgi:hypothetical protein
MIAITWQKIIQPKKPVYYAQEFELSINPVSSFIEIALVV